MSKETEEKVEMRRTEENYYQDRVTNNMTATGVKDWSVFNTIPHFHVVKGTSNDVAHDLLEGVLPYSHKSALQSLIFERGRSCTVRNVMIVTIICRVYYS